VKRKPYPLDSAHNLNRIREEEAQTALLGHRSELERAGKALEKARQEERDHQQVVRAFVRRGRSKGGVRTAADLQRQADYAKHLAERGKRLRLATNEARTSFVEELARLNETADAVQQRRAERKAVERHRQRFAAQQRREAEKAAEEEFEETRAGKGRKLPS